MDCGPASLKALFAGYGQYLSYGRLREACQTDVDGTSIDTLETVAQRLGLQVEQRMMPADLLLLSSSACLPALIVTRLPGGATHFVVLWRAHGSRLQVMDPAAGRVWVQRRQFLQSLYTHQHQVSRADWEEWTQSPAFAASLIERMNALVAPAALWPDRSHQDAALRLVGALRDAGAIASVREAQEVLALCRDSPEQIPAEHWFGRAAAADAEQVCIRGAVLLAASDLRPQAAVEPLSGSLAFVRSEPPPRPWSEVLTAIRSAGYLLPAVAMGAMIFAALSAVFEMLLFLGLLASATHLKLAGQRAGAFGIVVVLLAALLAIEWAGSRGLLHAGRHLEIRLRTRLLLRIPALEDVYFRSRLMSDMAFRAHALHLSRELPQLAGNFVRCAASLLFTAAAISWLYPQSALAVWLAVAATAAVPLIFQPAMVERDLRVRELAGALSRFYLDALLGSRAIQAHGAERTLRSLHAAQLAEWARAGLRQQVVNVGAATVQLAIALAPVIYIVLAQGSLAFGSASLLLLVYWTLTIPTVGQEFAAIVWSLPRVRNTLVRYLELLGAPASAIEAPNAATPSSAPPSPCGPAVSIDEVTIIAGGHTVLDGVSLQIAAGEHVGIVGPSGAGKSALVGLLLGWYTPAQGCVRVDGATLDAAALARLREQTAWIDPQVHLFQATLLDNLRYGSGADTMLDRLESIIDETGLIEVLQKLPQGMRTQLGAGGALVAGGEGQRVRIGRAFAKNAARLAILDEPARGLPRAERAQLLAIARARFAGATLFFVTHDVEDTLGLDRVVVLEGGRIVEQGAPRELHSNLASRYRAMLDQHLDSGRRLWTHSRWRRTRLSHGVLVPADQED
jgi:ABC-type bacteriocin/lantibiotic exporter with double-glycine peptidase domain